MEPQQQALSVHQHIIDDQWSSFLKLHYTDSLFVCFSVFGLTVIAWIQSSYRCARAEKVNVVPL